jgi:hypothetical protein
MAAKRKTTLIKKRGIVRSSIRARVRRPSCRAFRERLNAHVSGAGF